MLLYRVSTDSMIKSHSSSVEVSAVSVRIWGNQRGRADRDVLAGFLRNAVVFGLGVGLYQQNRRVGGVSFLAQPEVTQ